MRCPKDSLLARLIRQALRPLGLGVVALSLTLAVPWGPVEAQALAAIHAAGQAIQAVAQQETTTTVEFTPPASPSPSPAPGSSPLKSLKMKGGGPIRFDFIGNVTAGTQIHTQSYQTNIFVPPGTSPTPSPTGSPLFPFQNQSQSSTYNQSAAAAQAEISRRTAQTYTDIRFPIAVATVGGQVFGTVQALYSTARYSIGYASQNFVLFGQLPLGSTLRGLQFILPSSWGQSTFYEGATTGVNGEVDRAAGVIAQANTRLGYLEGGVTVERGTFSGKATTFVVGAATGRGNFSVIGEGAYQVRDCSISPRPPIGQTGCDGTPHGPAFQLRLDNATNTAGWGMTLRSIPTDFVAFGSGEIYGDRYADVNVHTGQSTVVAFDANYERTGIPMGGGTNTQYVESLSIGGGTHLFGYTLGLAQQNVTSVAPNAVAKIDSSGLQFQIQPRTSFAETTLGAQLLRSVQDGQASSTSTLAADFNRSFGNFGVGLIFQSQLQTAQMQSSTKMLSEAVTLTKQFGKTTFGFTGTLQHTLSPFSDAVQRTPLLLVTRQISPSLSVQGTLGEQILTDKLNPAANGRTRIIGLAINAPFSYGNGITTGRVDPRLPATIIGKVLTVAVPGTSTTLASLASLSGSGGGLGNVAVVLDDRQVERTDLTGGFQFPFLSPGQHQLRVENSTLPRGVTVSTPIVTVVVQGGQVATVNFQVGTFGGVTGKVTGLDTNGNPVPLQNVKLRIDGGEYSTTDASGTYGFGGLAPGQHTVEVIENTVPAYANFDPNALSKKVQVTNGQYTTVDFGAQPLGSIAGKIVYAPDVANENLVGGVVNAYVVAEPGEHAAIDDDDGSFIIDNLPPGDYTVSVDNETITEGFGAAPDELTIHLGPGEHYEGATFNVGHFEKKVVFSLMQGNGASGAPAAPAVTLSEHRLPPLGSTLVTVNAPASAGAISLFVFGSHTSLTYDKTRSLWAGEILVPEKTPAGSYDITASASSGTVPTEAKLVVDPKMPLAILTPTPKVFGAGANIKVSARFLVDVKAGDKIEWEDGTETVLGK
ncbi:MAG: carboxypeptidase regulatory-like domain-containing protein, partial [Candidatus Eremiobacteraeota bacterium]|nr:carboxypeptidase regulatory-like domain-containing protein [Candidatus Eremiobacteraeota bacterium]